MLITALSMTRPKASLRYALTALLVALIQTTPQASFFFLNSLTQRLLLHWDILAIVLAAGYSLVGSLYIFDDLFDLEEDRINHPERPLPSGRIGSAAALSFGLILLTISFLTAWVLSPPAIVIPLTLALLLFVPRLFRRVESHWGGRSVTIFSLVFSAFWLGFLAYPTPSLRSLALGGTLGYLHVWTRLISDLADLEGDRHSKLKTLPNLYFPSSIQFIRFGLISSGCLVIMPFFFGFHPLYLLAAIPVGVSLIGHGLNWQKDTVGSRPSHLLALILLTGALISS